MDFRLKGSDELTLELEKQVSRADTLLLFLSPGWIASKWCRRELEIFISAPARQHSGRIFVVEADSLETTKKPEVLRDCLGYRFWEKTDEDRIRKLGYPLPRPDWQEHSKYFTRLFDVSQDLAKRFQDIAGDAPSSPETKATVYVAPVGDALYEQRSNLITELRQFGIDSIPRNNAFDLDSFKQAMERDLAHCSHLIQLLDADWNFGVPAKQLQMAETNRKPILEWRGRELDYNKAREEQKKLLESKQVIACTLSEFAQHVRKVVVPEPESKPEEPDVAKPPITQKMVFVHTGQQDFELAEKIAGGLRSKGYGYVLPRYSGDPASIRKSIERGLRSCNVLLMLQRETPAETIEDVLSASRGVTSSWRPHPANSRRTPPSILATKA